MYPGTYATQAPDRVAAVMTGTGESLGCGSRSAARSSVTAATRRPSPRRRGPAAGAGRGPELAQEIVTFVKSKIAGFKAPKVVRFVDDLPRTETGKLMKSELKAKYARR